MLKLEYLTKTFQQGRSQVQAVKDVKLTIEKGDVYGIIGYSGAGKSTLIRLLNRLEEPSSGKVWIGSRELTKMSRAELRQERQKIGMIFQHFHLLWSRTVVENILFPLEIAGVPSLKRKERALELIRLVGLEGKENVYPSQLSGGQKQRVGIARALANDPGILLCDEATSALDPQTTDQILDLLADINQKMQLTIVLITHEMGVVRKICNRVAVMENGEIVEEGKVMDVFRHPQQEITRQFVQRDTGLANEETRPLLQELKQLYPKGKMLRITFNEETVQKPILSKISRRYDVDFNIIQGTIQPASNRPIGSLVVQLLGKEADMQKVLDELKAQGAETEEMDTGDRDAEVD